MFVVFSQVPKTDEEEQQQLNIILMKNYVLTIHKYPIEGLDFLMKRVDAECELSEHAMGEEPLQTREELWSIQDISQPRTVATDPTARSRKYDSRKQPNLDADEDSFSVFTPTEFSLKKRRGLIPSADWVLYAFLVIYLAIINVIGCNYRSCNSFSRFISR